MATAAALNARGKRDTSKTVRGEPTRLAKRFAFVKEPARCTRECGLDIPGHRNKSDVTSSPSAYAMYLSTTDFTGVTQATRITPPNGYSNTNCCATSGAAGDLADCDLRLPPNTASPAGCCIYRGRGRRPVKKFGPGQLAQWRMGPTPNRMQRIGNVKPRSADTTARAIRVGEPVVTSNLTVANGTVIPVLDGSGAYTTYLKESIGNGCDGPDCFAGGPWQGWPITYSSQGRQSVVRQIPDSNCQPNPSPGCLTSRLATTAQPSTRCSPYVSAINSRSECPEQC
jgi:hypothetical protein